MVQCLHMSQPNHNTEENPEDNTEENPEDNVNDNANDTTIANSMDWIIDFSEVTTLNEEQKKKLCDLHYISELFKEKSTCTIEQISQFINTPPYDISTHYECIRPLSWPTENQPSWKDIYLMFIQHLITSDVPIWQNFMVGANKIPERIFEVLVSRFDLERNDFIDEDTEILRYSLIYIVINFHLHNINYMIIYNTILKESLAFEAEIQSTRPLSAYINKVHRETLQTLRQHQVLIESSAPFNYKSILEDIGVVYSNINILQKMIYILYVRQPICINHIIQSGYFYDKEFTVKFMNFTSQNQCICDNVKPVKGKISAYVQQINKLSQNIIESQQHHKHCFASFDYLQ